MISSRSDMERTIDRFVNGEANAIPAEIISYGIALLPVLSEKLAADLPMAVLERYENILKILLHDLFQINISGETARAIAQFQRDLGFMLKYKSYTVKATTPLGYSVFIQNQGEGFSFQRHVSYKTEVFHILEVKPGGYVYICEYDQWLREYDQEAFTAWLNGAPNPAYDRHRIETKPGDVFVIDRLNVVHTVIGCVLEEFATCSTDVVDRLHDQNAGKPIPANFDNTYTVGALKRIQYPDNSRQIDWSADRVQASPIAPTQTAGGDVLPLARTEMISASRINVPANQTTGLAADERLAATLHVLSGNGRVVVADATEAKQVTPPNVSVSTGDLLLIPAGIHYGFINESTDSLVLSEHKVPASIAFAPESS